MKKTILLISGKKRSGKDYFSDILVNKGEYVKVALAKKLKESACSIANLTYDEMEDLKNNEGKFIISSSKYLERIKQELNKTLTQIHTPDMNVEYYQNLIEHEDFMSICHEFNETTGDMTFDARIFLQQIGGFWKDIFDNVNIWTLLLIKEIESIGLDHIIISDYRFPYEADLIKKHFKDYTIKTVKILGKNLYNIDKYDSHASETALNDSKFDYHINNTLWCDSSIYWQALCLIKTVEKE